MAIRNALIGTSTLAFVMTLVLTLAGCVTIAPEGIVAGS